MTTTSPNRIDALIQFGRTHAPVFFTNGAQIGVSTSQSTTYKVLFDAFDGSVAAAEKARAEAKRATEAQAEAMAAFRSFNGDIVRQIRSFAQLSADPDKVYLLSQVDLVAPPSPVGPPARAPASRSSSTQTAPSA